MEEYVVRGIVWNIGAGEAGGESANDQRSKINHSLFTVYYLLLTLDYEHDCDYLSRRSRNQRGMMVNSSSVPQCRVSGKPFQFQRQ